MNKLNGSVLVAVAMMFGAVGALGCNNAQDEAAQQESAPAPIAQPTPVIVQAKPAAPASNDEAKTIPASSTSPGTTQDSLRFRVDVPFAPPAARFENPGRPPSQRHFWVNGHHKHENGRYVWVGGRWDVRRQGHIFVQPRYDRSGSRIRYIPGHWVRR